MSEKINLISSRKKNVKPQSKSEKIFKLSSLVCLVLVALVAGGLFALKLTSPLPSLQKEESQLLSELQTLYPKTIKLLIIKNRLQGIAAILKQRPDLVKIINLVQEKKPQEISVTSLDVSASSITVAAASSSLSAVDQYLNGLVAIANEKKAYGSVSLESLSLDTKTSKYSLSLEIKLL